MIPDALDFWFRGATVLSLANTGDFASWFAGAPVLQLASDVGGIPGYQFISLGFLRSSG